MLYPGPESLPVMTGDLSETPANGQVIPYLSRRWGIPIFGTLRKSIFTGAIRAVYRLRFPPDEMFCHMPVKSRILLHIFSNTVFHWDFWQTGQYSSSFKTLLYAIGRRKRGCRGVI